MTKGSIGLNILGDRPFNRGVLIETVKRLAPAYCVVMNNTPLAMALMPYTTVIVRRTPDDDAQNHTSAADFVNARAADVPNGCYLYLTNEPGNSAAARLDTWTWEAMAVAEGRGIKCCILNWATGNPEPADWDKVALCIKRAVKNGHLIGVHEYFDRRVMKDYPYHVGRFIEPQQRFGGKWVITELGEATDLDPYKGWQTAYGEFEYYFELDGVAGMYASHGVGACIFSYPDWDNHGFGVDHPGLLTRLVEVNAKYPLEVYNPMPEVPFPVPTEGGVLSLLSAIPGTWVNVRDQPNGAQDVGDLAQGDVVNLFTSSDPRASGWVYIVPVNAPQALAGWVSLQGGKVAFTPVPPPTPAVTLPKADVEAIIVHLENAVARLRGVLLPEIPF